MQSRFLKSLTFGKLNPFFSQIIKQISNFPWKYILFFFTRKACSFSSTLFPQNRRKKLLSNHYLKTIMSYDTSSWTCWLAGSPTWAHLSRQRSIVQYYRIWTSNFLLRFELDLSMSILACLGPLRLDHFMNNT